MSHTKLLLTALIATCLMGSSSMASDKGAAPSFDSSDNLFSNKMTDSELSKERGTGMNVYNWSNMSAVMYGNSNNNSISGNNMIADGAFSGMNGLSTIIQNSGNNVIIQSSTILNVTFDSNQVTP